LGDNGHMPLASDHTCSDCTKPYKAGPDENEEDVQDILPVNMIVMDGIVMGPVVSLFKFFLNN